MIQSLATKYNKPVACLLGFIFYFGWLIPLYGNSVTVRKNEDHRFLWNDSGKSGNYAEKAGFDTKRTATPVKKSTDPLPVKEVADPVDSMDQPDIDGPSQPEMASFKPAGTNDMVNLFTGDFSYNIPLLDVGGYPVNIFYDGGITMEQEASWVGLGWNINPGNVNRNMRGVPDDFNGTEQLIQSQNMKKNVTWGVSLGADLELVGIKKWNAGFSGSIGASIGFSVNNHLGPAIELGLKGTTSFSAAGKTNTEKGPVGVSGGLALNLNSRNGLTFSPSLSARASLKDAGLSTGVGLSTSYNSRSGIKSLQISGQMSANYQLTKYDKDDKSKIIKQNGGSMGANIISSSISFTKPSYIPAMRSVITNSSGAGRFQIGGAMFGVYPSFEIEGYGQVSQIEAADRVQKKPMVGYLYAEKAKNNRDAVMDFSRFNDQEVTPSTTIISVPQYAYDVFSIQGEGTGGTIRAYRNDNGYVRDNFTASKDKSWSAGVDIGIPGHVGANFNTVKTPSTIGDWVNGNKLKNTIGFSDADKDRENVYFRNPGENSVLHPNQYDSIGGTSLVRYKLGGWNSMPTVEPKLQLLNASGAVTGEIDVQRSIGVPEREKRTQVTTFLTAKESMDIGLDKKIRIYDAANLLTAGNRLNYTEIERNSEFRRDHHISQITVTEADGKRYVYGLPVYNTKQVDYTFTVASNCSNCDNVLFTSDDVSLNSSHINSGTGGKDGYTQITETPPYAHSFLLSGLLSPDYVDVNGDGITEDDLGSAVKFNYTKTGTHKWRTPHMNGMYANSNPGNLSDTKDDKGIVSYGERESWYLQSIESKSMIAFFILEDRADGKGVSSEFGGINYSDNSIKRLKEIRLYNKADLKNNGVNGARPVKTVHFGYNYTLCTNTPDNNPGNGKLTLERIWFTYNGQTRANKNQYVFSYTKGTTAVTGENPSYTPASSDRWGNYKPAADNPSGMMNRDYPYSLQDKTKADQYANAWNLKKILLPSGGQIEVEYESDDYAFVQNKRAAVMSAILGFGSNNSAYSNNLYTVNGASVTENDYLFVKVAEACTSKAEVFQKYLQGVSQLAIRLTVNMPKGPENMTAYATVEDYDVYTGPGAPAIWIKMKRVNGYSPLSQTAVEFIRQRLPGQAFPGYDVSDNSGIEQVLNMISGLIDGIKSAFKDIPKYLRQKGLAQSVQVSTSFARLNDPDGYKYGGGQRVKKISLKDNWNRMTNQYASVYGQSYDYTTKEVFNGTERTISSGVASYEPSIGGEENPFQTIVQITNEVPLGPASYGAIEMPVMDAFFPAPVVGYSKVTVTSLGKNQNPDPSNKKTRSGVGKQVSEFYTAKDFPVYYSYSPLDPSTDKQEHVNPTLTFFYKYAMDSRAISQGFLIATNDMHGKMKSQSSYAENDPNTRINYTENFYRNTGTKGFDDKFDFVHNNLSGEVIAGNMGIDIELMTDVREFLMKSNSFEIQGQVDWMLPPPFPLWLPFIWPVVSQSENVYRAVTTTKVINYHAVLDSVVVIDKGSQVSTKNLIYDAQTGQVVVNRTNNEFNKPIYSVSYPAYWAYSGMGLAYKNIDAVYTGVNFLDGRITGVAASAFESGDELYVFDPGSTAGCDPVMASSGSRQLIWAFDLNKNNSSLTNPNPDFIFIDQSGKPYSRSGVKFRIVRSGKRNMLGAPLTSFTMMNNPVDPATHKLLINTAGNVINSSAAEYKEKWQTDNDVFKKYKLVIPVNSNGPELVTNGNFSSGNTGFVSDYTYSPGAGTGSIDSYYNVAPATDPWYAPFFDCGDHTSGTGNMMMVNGAQVSFRVWSQTIVVTPNTNYKLSAWAASIAAASPANLIFKINGIQVGSNLQLTSTGCQWTNYQGNWFSGSATTAVIAIYDLNTNWSGNDFVLDDISFYADYTCGAAVEVEDCSGYFEKKINPYVKGLLGNFRGYRNMVFYGDRQQTDPTQPTNLPVNGFLAGFTPYWNFNTVNNLVPDASNTKWVWNTESTKFNSKGMELETKDALNVYTSAQYGYAKTLPVAIASNSRYGHMFAESFEDYGYDDMVNNSSYNSCADRYINFSAAPGATIVNTNQLGFNSHTGRYALKIGADTAATYSFQTANPSDAFNLSIGQASVNSVQFSGPNMATFWNCGDQSIDNSHITGVNQWYTMTGWCDDPFHIRYYVKPNSTGNFAFQSFMSENGGYYSVVVAQVDPNTGDEITVYTFSQPESLSGSQWSYITNDFNINMCGGQFYVVHLYYHPNPAYYNNWPPPYTFYWCGISTSQSLLIYNYYQLITGTCSYTTPIAANSSMLTPAFAIPPSITNGANKMVFSAWVREASANVSNYTSNEVRISIGGNTVTLKPGGPVIEGWQRYEGYFNLSGGGTVELKLVNLNQNAPVYFDDIRIHPFNANMTSYVYDPVNLRLRAQLDANNYASFYEYDEEGTLVRTKVETREGIKTITESRSAKQKNISSFDGGGSLGGKNQ